MRWRTGRRSENVEDYRGQGIGRGMGGGLKFGGGAIIALVVAYFLGVDPRLLMGLFEGVQTTQVQPAPPGGAQETGLPSDDLAQFVSVVLADTEDTWNEIFANSGSQYVPPKLVLFEGQVRSACGVAGASAGPFYCSLDQKAYIDLAFYSELRERFQAPGDFAQAYVIAHEIGHHVQKLTGISDEVHQRQQAAGEREANQLSVRLELQADCYAGVWAHHADRARQVVETGDVEEALGAAAAVGDDTLQQKSRGHVVPESFTHGSAQQRMQWFQRGMQAGSPEQCNTFAAR